MLTQERLNSALNGRSFEFYETITSSNDRALAWIADGARPGSLVIADVQTSGRGRLGRAWFAPSGTALMLSYILQPRAEHLPFVSMAGTVSVCEAIESFGGHVSIKWPNDVQIGGRKLCGVLPEANWNGGDLVGVALGIGINVRIDFSDTPFASTAISLEDVVGAVDRLDLLLRLLERLDHWSAQLSSDALFEEWQRRLTTFGQRVTVNQADGAITGTAEQVDRQGALFLRLDSGEQRRVIAGDIAFT